MRVEFSILGSVFVRVCLAAALATGCNTGFTVGADAACDPSAPLALTAQRRDSLRPADEGMRPDAQWARLARSTPGGFAGAYFESVPLNQQGQPTRRQRLVIRLARPTERSAALRALLPLLPATLGGVAVDSADVLIVPATWDFAELDDWRRYLDVRTGSPGMSSIGTDEAANQIRYGMVDAAARATLERRLRELRVPCGLVAIDVIGIVRTAGE
jgi:hypothetical protein